MSLRRGFGIGALLVTAALVTSQVISQDGKPEKSTGKDAPAMSPQEAEMMAKWAKAATPGEPHAKLAKLAGNWKFTIKYRMDENAPWTESTGTSEMKTVLDGRYVMDTTTGQTDMGPFQGLGMTGFDNVSQKYVSFWADNMGTSPMMLEGTADAAGKVITYMGTCNCPMEGPGKRMKMVVTMTDKDHFTHESYSYDAAGKEWKGMEIQYTRANAGMMK
ncbi:MAG: DUF1579 domain-containing protein [Planctomycetota bacterium]